MLTTKVFASTITNLTDARYFAAWEVDWLGFEVSENGPHALSADAVKEIVEWVDGVKIIGEAGLLNIAALDQILNSYTLDGIQFSEFTELQVMKEIPSTLTRFQSVRIVDVDHLEELLPWLAMRSEFVDYFLLDITDLEQPFSEQVMALIHRFNKDFPLVYDTNLSPKEMEVWLSGTKPAGIKVLGGMEEKVGYKSFEDLDELFEAIEILV